MVAAKNCVAGRCAEKMADMLHLLLRISGAKPPAQAHVSRLHPVTECTGMHLEKALLVPDSLP